MCDRDWEAEFCRVVERDRRVLAYVKNQGLGFEVPYQDGTAQRRYRPDFIVRVATGAAEPVNLVVEIKGQRDETDKDKANTIRAFWVPGVNNLGRFGRWDFIELTDVFQIEAQFTQHLDRLCAAAPAARNQP